MSLAEIVTIEVGSAIAKSILQLWVKNTPIVSDVLSSGLDVLKSLLSDRLVIRKAERQFDEIGEKVGESLLSLFEIEGAHLDEGSRTAVALAVAETFNRVSFTSELLVENHLQPIKLAQYTWTIYPEAKEQFSEAELALYDRIIKDSCEYILDIASQFPAFTENAFAEIFKKEEQLITITTSVLHELRQMRGLLNPMIEAEGFELEYRRAIIHKLDVLQLFGADISTASRRHNLSVAYVTLSVEQRLSNVSDDGNSIAFITKQEMPGKRLKVSVDKALQSSRRLLIRGTAGSGKTTLLQWIGVRSASRSFDVLLADWNSTIPFYIRLRQFTKTKLPTPENFPGLVASAISGTMPQGWVHTQLSSGKGILLIDGLDEILESKRESVQIWLKELVETFPKARFIITSRPHALDEGWMNLEGFVEAELQPMETYDISDFIDHWHNAIRLELTEEPEKKELDSLAEHLKEILKQNRSIRSLATNPLLCALLCALHRDRMHHLPSDRIELYEACCYMLLERLDRERHIELDDYPNLNYREKRILLQDLAYWLIKNGWSEVDRSQVESRFAKELEKMPNLKAGVSADQVYRLFIERSNLIREPAADRVDFTHRTFQEFLAAQAILDEGDIGMLIENAHKDQWREVIILAAGLAPEKIRDIIVRELISRGDSSHDLRSQIHLLAVSCLETSVNLDQSMKVQLEQRLSELVPPKDVATAKALAAAGELAIPYLSKRDHPSHKTYDLSIYTLALIGSEAALEALEEYAYNASPKVADDLVNAWDSFDRENYALRVLSHVLQGSYKVQYERLASLEGFQYLSKLTSLDISRLSRISDLRPLTSLTKLTSLDLSLCEKASDLSPLASLTNLTSLNISSCNKIVDLSPLASLTNLTSLNISSCKKINDLRPLTSLTKLTSLDLSLCEKVSDLSPLASLTNLTSLNISSCDKIVDLHPLANLKQLTSLSMLYCNGIIDLHHIGNLTNLVSISIAFCGRINDLTPLGNLASLVTLHLHYCKQVTDLSPLEKLAKLKFLGLNGITDRVVIPQGLMKRVRVIGT